MLDKGIVLFGGAFGEGLEPVGIVCHTVFLGPLPDAGSHTVGNRAVETCAIVNHVNQFVINVSRQIFVHLGTVEHILSVIF